MPETADVLAPIKTEQTILGVIDRPHAHVETPARGDVLRKIGEQADRLLKDRVKETKTIKSGRAYAAEELISAGWPPEQVAHRQSTETYLALIDKQNNASFVIEASPGYTKDERFITLRFQTIGENKGELGGGGIRLTYKNGQQEPIDIQTEKTDSVHLLQFSDKLWLAGDPAIYSPSFSPKFEHTGLSDANVAELFGRLASEGIGTDTTLTEKTARNSDMNHRLGHARSMLEIARQKGNQGEIAQAEQTFLTVRSEWETLWESLLHIATQAQPHGAAPEKPEEERTLQNIREGIAEMSEQKDASTEEILSS